MSATAVYLRVSSKSQSVKSQRREVQRYLDGHGIAVPDNRWFVDDGVSGATTDRPGLRKLRLAIFTGDVRCVVLYRLDRLARSIRDGINILTDWIGQGVRVVIVTMQIDLNGSLGQTIAALLLGLAQMEREAIRERQAAGIDLAQKEGRWEIRNGVCQACGRRIPGELPIPKRGNDAGWAAHAKVHAPTCQWVRTRGTGNGKPFGKRWGGRKPGTFKADPERVRELADKGLHRAEIAKALGISAKTVSRMLALTRDGDNSNG